MTPTAGEVVESQLSIRGSVDDSPAVEWFVEYRKDPDGAWVELANGAGPVAETELAVLDPTLLRNGLYSVRLRATDAAYEVTAERPIRLDGQLKIGHFTLSFVDAQLEVAGIPITVARSYDSRDKAGGEFGPGWRLALRGAELRDARLPRRRGHARRRPAHDLRFHPALGGARHVPRRVRADPGRARPAAAGRPSTSWWTGSGSDLGRRAVLPGRLRGETLDETIYTYLDGS